MIPAQNRRGALLSIRDRNPFQANPFPEDTSMPYSGLEPESIRLQVECLDLRGIQRRKKIGANVSLNFGLLRYTQADGPLVNSEFYPGYLDHWGHPHSTKTAESVVKTLNEMLAANASVNFIPLRYSNQALRIITGAEKSTPVLALQALADNEWPR
ncbi:hypothetical protein TNCV_4151431 [Trichonephila clavipes]|nr:hypothetical protein TNCV_4151431 [Trichonephila clavipes]